MERQVFNEEFNDIYFFHGSSQNWYMKDYHYHRNYEILLFTSDGATFLINDRSYKIREGDLFVIRSADYHKVIGGKNIPYNRYVIMFYPEKFRQLQQIVGFPFLSIFDDRPEESSHKINLTGKNFASVVDIMDKIDDCYSLIEDPANRALIDIQIMHLLVRLHKLYKFFLTGNQTENPQWTLISENDKGYKENFSSRKRIESIKQYVQEHIHEHISLQEIADEFFMSSYHLSHYFKQETGFTLFEYIKTQKITAAKGLLKKGYSVTEIAMMLGYSSDSHFISVFKRETGTTPKQYAHEKGTQTKEVNV